jgi:phosphohistidine phosphatase
MKYRPGWFYQQAGVIPYRVTERGCEVLLITSRRGRWIIPKGVIDPGMTPQEAARQEAYEEAGVAGAISDEPLGEYRYHKWGGVCTVQVFALAVQTVLDTWPEASARQRRWLAPADAARAVDKPQLRPLILTVAEMTRRPADE